MMRLGVELVWGPLYRVATLQESFLSPYSGSKLQWKKVKVRFTVVQATKAKSGSRGIALLFL
jgi:hypothetical protein